MTDLRPTVRMLGTHGVPAAYGGFETAAENIALYLHDRGWRVIVYCQTEGSGPITEDTWRGIERVNIPISAPGWRGTGLFDLKSVRHASRFDDLCLVFGYNTGALNAWQRLKRIPLVINMDGIEWARAKWGPFHRAVLYVNERFSAAAGHMLIADHPVIEQYLHTRAPARKITTITYGAPSITQAPTQPVTDLGLEPGRYVSLVCRPVPENSVLELVEGFSRHQRDRKLLVLGSYQPDTDPYHRAVREAASAEVIFAGSIYDPQRLAALRFHSALYAHGHTVGGTNPSLVEALGAGNPVLAHDNPYNRWTAGPQAAYFATVDDAARQFDRILTDAPLQAAMSRASRERHLAEFTWEHVASQYEQVLRDQLVAAGRPAGSPVEADLPPSDRVETRS